jgi:hypothetical protein
MEYNSESEKESLEISERKANYNNIKITYRRTSENYRKRQEGSTKNS